jgi:membrane fusion protein (multidrug efflux system)
MKNQHLLIGVFLLLGVAAMFFGYSKGHMISSDEKKAKVKSMQPLQQDVDLSYKYVGTIKAKDEVKIQSRVSGTVVEKYIEGGQLVTQGQALYKIDSRQYASALLGARATLAQAEASLQNAETDLARNQQLLAVAAVAEQKVTTQESLVKQYRALVAANEALVKKAEEDLSDTVIYAPVSGRVDLKDVAIGTYVSAGSTTLATVGSSDPIEVEFNISENEYLKTISQWKESETSRVVNLTLSNGEAYPFSGTVLAVDRSLTENTGTLSIKASFPNEGNRLLPGMFARVRLKGAIVPNAILVPQRAVQQLLDKTFVNIVREDGKAGVREVKLGDKIGSYYIIEQGVTAQDQIIVEGLVKIQDGMAVDVTVVTPEDMGFSLQEDVSENKAATS